MKDCIESKANSDNKQSVSEEEKAAAAQYKDRCGRRQSDEKPTGGARGGVGDGADEKIFVDPFGRGVANRIATIPFSVSSLPQEKKRGLHPTDFCCKTNKEMTCRSSCKSSWSESKHRWMVSNGEETKHKAFFELGAADPVVGYLTLSIAPRLIVRFVCRLSLARRRTVRLELDR